MYQSQRPVELSDRPVATAGRAIGFAAPGRNVWMLGLTSLLTDASSEMVAAVLPVYALYFLRASPAAFGVIDGLQQGGASLARLAAGWFTDYSRRHKAVAATGYLASVISKLGLLVVAGSAGALTLLTLLDRVGKGIRTAPRDAMISLSVPRAALASAFGIHRALDTAGAMIGPVLAFVILAWIANGYDVVFVVSLALGVIGVAALVLFVDTSTLPEATTEPRHSPGWPRCSARFYGIACAATLLGLATISDSFIYLTLQQKAGFDVKYLPLLFVATPAVYLVLAVPAGRLADRVGRPAVIAAGYLGLLALYAALSSPLPPVLVAVLTVGLLGAFYAMTDGVFAALASAELSAEQRATGLALVGTGNDVGRLVSSVVFGWLWSRGSPDAAVVVFVPMLLAAVAASGIISWRATTGSAPEER